MIKVFTGPMFSGKSDALLNEYDKRYHKSRILLFKPKMDTRDYGVVKTRKGKEIMLYWLTILRIYLVI